MALKQIRVSRGLGQQELAGRVNMTRATIANLERGLTRARPSTASQLASALGVSVDVLTGGRPLPTESQSIGVLSAYLDTAMRHAVFRRAGEQQRVYAAIPGIQGLWARGQSHEEAEKDLREALEWWVLTAIFEHQPLPAFDGVSLEIVEEGKDGSTVLYPAAESSESSFLDHFEDAEPIS